VHYEHAVIRAWAGDGSAHGVTIGYQVEETPRGTAGALRDALPRLQQTFLVLYGDTYVDVDLRQMWVAHQREGADATALVHPNDHPDDSDLVELDRKGFIAAIHAYPHVEGRALPNLVNAGLYVMQREACETVLPLHGQADLVKHTFPAMLRDGRRLFGYRSPEYIKDFGTPDRLDQVEHDVRMGMPERLSVRMLRPAVFLDRDGTLNADVHYLNRSEQVQLLDGVAAAVRRINRAGRLAVVVTNQPAIARGELTDEGLAAIHRRLTHLLGRGGAYVDALYVCPHHPDRGFAGEVAELKVECDCRKPRTGLVDCASRDLLIDRTTSWFVGDTTSDIETGRRAGVKTILVRTGYAGQDGKHAFRPDYVAADLPAAVGWILDGHQAVSRRLAPVAVAALDKRLVLVGGLARSGKSSAAQVLKEALAFFGRTAHVLSLDSWLKPQGERAEGTGVGARFDTDRLLATLQPIVRSASRHSLALPIYDRARRQMYEQPVHLSIGPDDLLIVEGVPALLVDELVNLADLRLHIEMPESRRLAHLRADYRWRGEPEADVDALVASRAVDESPLVQQAAARADFVIPAWADA
jgi:histidinol-phosphate phosphatase family protein